MEFTQLDPSRIIWTIRKNRFLVDKHFPDSGLALVAGEFEEAATDVMDTATGLRKPLWGLRIGVLLGLAALLIGIYLEIQYLRAKRGAIEPVIGTLEGLDAGLNILILIITAVVFLVTTERRIKRDRALVSLNQLRSLAHIIDMHQISKDPAFRNINDPFEPIDHEGQELKRTVRNDLELWQYLDHCGDLLSLVGKLAAFYAQNYNDRVVLEGVSEVEVLSAGLSRKIWQKMLILDRQGS